MTKSAECRSPRRCAATTAPRRRGRSSPRSVPKLVAGYQQPLPLVRPTGLRTRRVQSGVEIWRIEARHPSDWTWAGFAQPRFRFDPASGSFRTRYGATRLIGAFRERSRPTGLVIPDDDVDHHLVRLTASRSLRGLELRTEKNLDALKVDDQISTGQHPAAWATCHRLSDEATQQWG